VVVVPDDAESATAAGSAARAAAAARAVDPRSPRVAVLPACAPVPALAALSVHDAARSLPLAVEAMSAAAAATRAGVVRTAGAADAPVSGCRSGDAVGLVGSEVVAVGADAAVVGEAVADRLLGAGGELLTVLHGALPGAHPAASALSRAVRRARPDVEVHVLDGGQEGAVLLLGVE
jgi:dihydroxyacetone kinase-like predicted kinase